MEGKYFRAGVGAVIYNAKDEIALFRRCAPPVGTWQFPQGGIDTDTSPTATLWRELQEETGLTQADIDTVTEYPDWTIQVYPDEILHQPDQPNPNRLGQVHRWYFLQIAADTEIDLSQATDEEFDACRWVSWDEALTIPKPYKAHVYQALHDYYKTHISASE